jgi:hypothetical protein
VFEDEPVRWCVRRKEKRRMNTTPSWPFLIFFSLFFFLRNYLPFVNPARTDGLLLHHWVKSTDDPKEGFNRKKKEKKRKEEKCFLHCVPFRVLICICCFYRVSVLKIQQETEVAGVHKWAIRTPF